MREEILVLRPQKIKILDQNGMKIQNSTLPKFEFSILEHLGFEKMRNRDIKTKILTLKEFGFPKNEKSAPQNLKFDFDFEFQDQKFDFEILKIVFSNSSRILLRDLKI